MSTNQEKRVYVTCTDARTRRSKATTVPGMTPTQIVRLLTRIRRGEVQVIDTPKVAVAAA